MKNRRFLACFPVALFLFSLIVPGGVVLASQPPEDLPPALFTIPAPDAQAQKYLGLKSAEPFTLAKTNAKIVVVEFFAALCPMCHANAPMVNRIYKAAAEDASLAEVKVIGIALGSEPKQVEAFRKNFKVPFPTFIDEQFAISAAMDGVETPTTMIISTKDGKVLSSHKGVIKDYDGFMKELKGLVKK
ncbi:MAG: TlpA family protein disulfide reductase [Desulfobacteraceae bacterium]|nr:TlpA family protein disulfide reductase [Desulfobacteraceae bacterium]